MVQKAAGSGPPKDPWRYTSGPVEGGAGRRRARMERRAAGGAGDLASRGAGRPGSRRPPRAPRDWGRGGSGARARPGARRRRAGGAPLALENPLPRDSHSALCFAPVCVVSPARRGVEGGPVVGVGSSKTARALRTPSRAADRGGDKGRPGRVRSGTRKTGSGQISIGAEARGGWERGGAGRRPGWDRRGSRRKRCGPGRGSGTGGGGPEGNPSTLGPRLKVLPFLNSDRSVRAGRDWWPTGTGSVTCGILLSISNYRRDTSRGFPLRLPV